MIVVVFCFDTLGNVIRGIKSLEKILKVFGCESFLLIVNFFKKVLRIHKLNVLIRLEHLLWSVELGTNNVERFLNLILIC